jgi:cytochrome c oxidase assembly protein subunit 15
MTDEVSAPGQLRAVRVWLYAVAAMIFLTLVVGGATRLTESGLSITEWKPVTGVLPPLTDAAWQDEFTKYQAIPQYQQINRGMSLGEFKTIYWWEWTHRLLARSTGAVFLLPFLFFLWRGWIPPPLKTRLWLIFGAGAALGAVGWWMVASGLVGRTSVSQYRLAFHLTLACLIYAAVVWTARGVFGRHAGDAPPLVRRGAALLMALVLIQIYLGALVAGLRAGLAYNTWPLIDGAFVPDAARLMSETPAWRNLFENVLTVQFNHRMVAYAVWLVAVAHLWSVYSSRTDRPTRLNAVALALLVTAQAILGILTLVHVVPLGLAIVHQGFAVVVLTAAVVHAERLCGGARRQVVSGHAVGQGA